MKKLLSIVALSLLTPLTAFAAVRGEEVEYKHGEVVLRGFLAYDDASKDLRPGILVVHEWWGHNEHARRKARDLARDGYIALAVDMYGEGKNTDHPGTAGEWSQMIAQSPNIGRGRFEAAYELLSNHRLTAPRQMAAVGYCFGGTTILTLAQSGIDLDGVVSFHGGPPAYPPQKTFSTKVLILHGSDDPMATRGDLLKYEKALTAVNADWQSAYFGGAQHSFTNPDADQRGIPGLKYDRKADQRSWQMMLSFLDELFAAP
ncbi:MAG: dienelactone hydrolase family protein [Acidobacteriota bacterium]